MEHLVRWGSLGRAPTARQVLVYRLQHGRSSSRLPVGAPGAGTIDDDDAEDYKLSPIDVLFCCFPIGYFSSRSRDRVAPNQVAPDTAAPIRPQPIARRGNNGPPPLAAAPSPSQANMVRRYSQLPPGTTRAARRSRNASMERSR